MKTGIRKRGKTAKKEDSPGIVSFEHGGKILIQCQRDGHIMGYDSVEVAITELESAYARAMGDGPMSRMIVLLGTVLFRVKVHSIKDQNWLRGNVIPVPYDIIKYGDKTRAIYGIVCSGPRSAEWHSRGSDIRIA